MEIKLNMDSWHQNRLDDDIEDILDEVREDGQWVVVMEFHPLCQELSKRGWREFPGKSGLAKVFRQLGWTVTRKGSNWFIQDELP